MFASPAEPSSRLVQKCQIVSVGKRRDGGTRYWCLNHKADATAKYGRPADRCRHAHIPPINPADILRLNLDQYKGGIALWGAVPPVYDTTRQPLDRGIHVHARSIAGGPKDIDRTFRAVKLIGSTLPKGEFEISELDAIYYMVTSIFGYEMKEIVCTYCDYSHLDKDWFSVHEHRQHLCAGCGRHFRDTDAAIGNPICRVRDAYGRGARKLKSARAKLEIRQADYPGGIQIWGSNAAIIWTAEDNEEEGIHVHAFHPNGEETLLDDTFSSVIIDGVSLNPSMVRTLMAQSALPHIEDRVVGLKCPSCGKPMFSVGVDAFTPTAKHRCGTCGRQFTSSGRFRKTIGNPLVSVLEQLAAYAPRLPHKHSMGLLPETL